MDKNSARSFLIQSCFGNVDDSTRRNLENISYFHAKKKRKFLFHEGEEGKFGYFLASGSIKLFRANADGKEVAIKFVRPGEFFGWLVLLMEGRYPVSAICLEHVETLAIDINGIRSMLRDCPDFAMRMFEYIARRQRACLNSIKDLAISCPGKRFLNYLNHLSLEAGSSSFQLPVPKHEIALLLGCTPETLSRLIRKFIDDDIINVEGQEIYLLK
ncbi:MAG: Crp/Fnr family transcriptional regulator [Deltaproteobacteria bacterium]|nr:Crp/Fnr family transcriptional regulator [Deltaproteobacteria bacterium]MDL1961118.1 Crp/Fnr family transcriptional regulator [Deltaproteobacteria bacterium]